MPLINSEDTTVVQQAFKYAVNSTADSLMAATKGVMCLTTGIFGILSNPTAVLGGLANAAIGLATSIIGIATKIIMDKVHDLTNSILSPLRLITAEIQHLTATLLSIQQTVYKLKAKAKALEDYLKSRQDCSAQAANMLNCLVQNINNRITNSVAKNIDKALTPLVNKVDLGVRGVNGSLHSHIKRYTRFVDKADKQTKLMI
jgi:hypothetical protein